MLGTNLAALMRAVGQLALMVIVAIGLWSIVGLVIACATGPEGACANPPPEWILFHLTRSLIPVVALVAFWASLRPHRARVAVAGAVGLLVLELVMPIFWITVAPDGELLRATLVAWALDEARVLVGMGLFLASCSRRTPAAVGVGVVPDGSRRGSWWMGALALLFVAVWLCALVSPVSPDTAVMLIAAALYGLLHRIRPLPGAARPTMVAVAFIPLALPHQLHVVAAYGDFGLVEPKLMLAIAVASWILLAGLVPLPGAAPASRGPGADSRSGVAPPIGWSRSPMVRPTPSTSCWDGSARIVVVRALWAPRRLQAV